MWRPAVSTRLRDDRGGGSRIAGILVRQRLCGSHRGGMESFPGMHAMGSKVQSNRSTTKLSRTSRITSSSNPSTPARTLRPGFVDRARVQRMRDGFGKFLAIVRRSTARPASVNTADHSDIRGDRPLQGGTGGSIAYNREEFSKPSRMRWTLALSTSLVEESVLGWRNLNSK